jgi:regulatory protein
VADAYTIALTLLSARELSERQLRTRLTRRELDPGQIDDAVKRLLEDGTLNDRRVALAAARMESAIRHRGRARVLQRIRQLGIDSAIAESAVNEVFEEVDEAALLDRALERRLRGRAARDLDEHARARIVRGLAAQGFALEAILKRLRSPEPGARSR